VKNKKKLLVKILFIIGFLIVLTIFIHIMYIKYNKINKFKTAVERFDKKNHSLAASHFSDVYFDYGIKKGYYQKTALIGLALIRIDQKNTEKLDNVYREIDVIYPKKTAAEVKNFINEYKLSGTLNFKILKTLSKKEFSLIEKSFSKK
jgi:hypothetical protein